ncbi:MAG: exodeoxyribonuclease V subunit gamma, partial [Nocardioides sp.]|nr:exodeoxyribonuclease V subunit gamma [Nocardioides sp.]
SVAAAGAAGDAARLRLPDVRSLLRHLLAGRPTRSSFRTGTLTVCTMVPMRSVPHRVVALVGLDDGVFPRVQTVDGDDVLARVPRTGERDVRSEDRQLLLDAVLAARETLVVTYDGANEHTGAPRPPAVPLGELLDTLDATALPDPDHRVRDRDGDLVPPVRVRDQVVLRHPLQPYDDRNLAPGALVPAHPFSFDPTALAGATAARTATRTAPPFLPGPLPSLPAGDVALHDLRAFLVHPVRWFLRSRLDVGAALDADELPVAVPITLDNLEQWGVGDRILRDVLAGAAPQESMLAEQLRGLLPPGGLGRVQLEEVVGRIRPLHARAVALRTGDARSVDVDVDLGDGRRLRGTVDDLYGHRQVRVTFSRLGPRVRLESWVDLVALSASFPDQHWIAHAVGRGPGRQVAESLLGPLDHRAVDRLRELVDLFDRGSCEPLPLPLKTAQVYAEERERELRGNSSADPLEKARTRWETNRFEGGWAQEDGDPHHVRVLGESCPVARLHALPPRDDEWWVPGEGSRMGQLALRLWSPIFAAGREGAL